MADVSSIPLAMVDRIEIVLDGASAIYGSDAVGGVVNVITKTDYEDVTLNLNSGFASDTAYNEFRGGIAATQNMGNTRISGSFNQTVKSGLDASDRDEAIFRQSIFPGPQFEVYSDPWFPFIFCRLDGNNLTLRECRRLNSDDFWRAVDVPYAVLPPHWTSSSSVDSITQFERPSWGPETQKGYSVIPQESQTSISGSVESALSDMISAMFRFRYERRTTTFEQGYITFSGQSMHPGNPFNPFDVRVFVRGQRRDIGTRPYTETDTSTLDWTASVQGDLNDAWSFEGSFGRTTTTLDAGRYNQLDSTAVNAGLNTNGVTPIWRWLIGLTPEECAARGGVVVIKGTCDVWEDPPDPVDPWGDLSNCISDTPLMYSSENGLTRLEGLVRGELFSLPGGNIRALRGFSWSNVLLETITEFPVGIIESSPVSNVAEINTLAERANSSFFMELSVPLIGEDNATWGLKGLVLSFSARNDTYDTPDITYTQSDSSSLDAGNLADIGGTTTWGVGLVYTATDGIRVRFNAQSAFVAPQLNQLLLEISEVENRVLLIQPDGYIRHANAIVKSGGNPDLLPETAESLSFGFDFRIPSVPLFEAKLTWRTIDYQDRISLRLSPVIFYPDNPPSNTRYDADTDTWFQDRRWMNVSSVERTGIDLELHYGWSIGDSLFNCRWRRSHTSTYDFILDPATDKAIQIVGDVTDEQGQASMLPPVSKSRDSMQFTWERGRMTASLDVNTSSKTTRTFGATTSAITREYTPPTLLDLTVNYNLDHVGWLPIPESFADPRVLLTINNITNAFGELRTFNAQEEELEPTSPSGSPLYGRVFHLAFSAGLRGF